tara:strand:+ start:1468 stop:1905 length:438 start_codon:yes stop_codon:yes gene_type:complete
MNLELNKTYTYECQATFGTLSQEKVNKLFTDGRRASGFLEIQLEEWFPDLTFEDGKGYDHVDKNGIKYDAKCFTPRGANFSPSVMLGAGRKVDKDKLWEHANDMIYIFCDIVSFPKVRVIFKKGSDLTQYNRGSIPFGDRDVLFG